GLVSFWTFVSRIMGLVRDIVLTGLLGAGVALDAFVVMMKIPSVFRRLFAEGAFNQAFIPVLAEYKENNSTEETKDLINFTFGALSSALLCVTILALLAAPIFVMIFAPGFYLEPLKKELAIDILQITFPYLFFISLVALSGSILNSYERFSLPALTPLFYNLSLIAAAVWFAPALDLPIYAIAWAVFFAGIIQVLIQIPSLMKLGLLPRFKLDLQHPGVRKVMFLMIPGIIAGGVSQINMLVDTILASLLPTGSPSWLYVSDRLMQLPLGIFAIAIATVILPKLSNLFASESREQFSSTLDWSIRLILLIGLPAVIGLVMLAEPIILTLFERGEFGAQDSKMASSSLIALAFGLLAFMLIKILTPSFFARQQPKKPMIVALISMVLNAFLAWLLAFRLGYAHVGLALASSISAFFTVITLLFILRKDRVYKASQGWIYFLLRMLIASIVLIVLIGYFGKEVDYLRQISEFSRFLYIIKIVLIGMVGYFLSLWILGIRIKDFSNKDVFD
ncbi:MAG TPA: murein biosynthesis integral membrane protein MurJ, partial [SAR86 cluster bacterium]|nr:murein biosynthesis integral membrane protein MurJ [SAR86 cluster bacterium]